ncbi:FAD binding domain protein [Colletotrichum asianum]|uniref:FAD binding domain-containing protein n=1 Tax=Colletotrichum asianum TaxID=702518 RepID=A0A8H3WRK4_9PEZI|nr:FAD binding domain-containing protein [Colletotrichum asianum]
MLGSSFLPAFLIPQLQGNNEISLSGSSCEQACHQLSLEFGSAVHVGGNDPDFSVWDAKQQEVVPACRIEPTSASDVARALEIIVDNWCRFAVKGGGHSTNVDASNSVGGVTIDLNRMDHIELADDRSWANLGPGLVLGEAYTVLEQHELSSIAGRVADVGVPGYTLGGGISNLSPQYGLAVDNVYEYQVVLPNSTIVNASETANPDLYFALRGGGNNFGIVTNFRSRLVSQGKLLSGDKTFHANYTAPLLDEVFDLTTAKSNDTSMCFSTRYFWDSSESRFRMSVTQAYYEPILEPAVFDSLSQIPFESSTVRVDWMSNFALENVGPRVLRRLYATVTFRPSRELYEQVQDIFAEEAEAVKDTPGFTSSIVLQALHINAIKAMTVRGGNALGIESDEPLNIALFTLGWRDREDDEAMNTYADRWLTRSKQRASEMNLLHPWLYINYAKHDQDPFSGYGETNKLRLQRIQKAVDPRGIMTSQGLCRGSFKLN